MQCTSKTPSVLLFALAMYATPVAASAALYLETWVDASVAGFTLSGSFEFDPATYAITNDTTTLQGYGAINVSGYSPGNSLDKPYYLGTGFESYFSCSPCQLFVSFTQEIGLGTVPVTDPIYFVTVGFPPPDLRGGQGGLRGELLVPSPDLATGIPGLIALGGAVLWLRRNWLRQTLRR
jgi:hypothetical protein